VVSLKSERWFWPAFGVFSLVLLVLSLPALNKVEPPVPNFTPQQQLHLAVMIWSKALGRSIPEPEFQFGICPGDPKFVACADKVHYRIIFRGFGPRRGTTAEDLTTVMMHEVGHLLGVSHIPGDKLMNPQMSGPVAAPTPAAVAVAKAKSK